MYGTFDQQQDILTGIPQEVTEAAWTTGSGIMTSFYTSSVQSGSVSGTYFYSVYDIAPTTSGSLTQFSVAYGNRFGSGSAQINTLSGDTGSTPSKAIYSQYRNYLLSEDDDTFTVDVDTNEIIVININRSRFKESIDVGNWELNFSGSATTTIYTFIDNTTGTTANSVTPNLSEGGENYYVVSGSINDGIYTTGSSQVKLGLVYPKQGLIILDAAKLRDTYGVAMSTASNVDARNHWNFINAMSEAGAAGKGFAMRSSQNVRSTYYFVRAKNREFSYSNNPSFYTTVNGTKTIRWSDMVNNPTVYITGIGLYNDANELLATAKISKPIKKTIDREALIRLRLDF